MRPVPVLASHQRSQRIALISFLFYLLGLTAISVHLYRVPAYDMDMVGYMGNALMTNKTGVQQAHDLVYGEVRKLPRDAQLPLLGLNASGSVTQDASRRARAEHAENFAEFLPCFAIRPLYNQALFLTSRIFGLTQAAILLSVGSYFLLGVLVFLWARRHIRDEFAALFALLLMLMAPMTDMGRTPISDAFSTLLAAVSLYLIFEKKRDGVGVALLLVSIFARTDNVALAAPVLLALWWLKRMKFWQMVVLGMLAAGSVLFINRMAGDYGLAMLYYRNFVATPVAPAEMVAHFSVRDYLHAFTGHLTVTMAGWLPFLMLALVGFLRTGRLAMISAIALTYLALHYVLLPNWQERWFVISYVLMALSAIGAVDAWVGEPENPTREINA